MYGGCEPALGSSDNLRPINDLNEPHFPPPPVAARPPRSDSRPQWPWPDGRNLHDLPTGSSRARPGMEKGAKPDAKARLMNLTLLDSRPRRDKLPPRIRS